jgi:glycine/D-amino acid oxidase-like deaminating enzyme
VKKPTRAVIIGAGITGALTAHALLEAGVAVTVLEAREKGSGSSSRSAACIRQQFSTPATVRAMVHSVRFYEDFAQRFSCAPGDGRALVQNGYLFLYDKPDQTEDPAAHAARWEGARASLAMQQENGLLDVVHLSPGEVSERFPHIDSERIVGATFCPSDGFLHPDIVYMEGFRRVEELGGVLRQNCPVMEGVFGNDGRLTAVRTDDGEEFAADLFINATNAWAPRLSLRLGGSALPINPLKRYLYFVHRGGSTTGAALLDWPMTITPSRAYCRPENADQLLAGWAHATEPEPEFGWSDQDLIEPPFFHKSGLDNYGFQLWMQLAEALPAIGEFSGIEATTAGYYAVTPDHNPILGFDPKQPTLLHAAGFSGHGAMMGPFTASVITQMALAGTTLPLVDIDGAKVDISALLVGRSFATGEGMVI